MSKPPLHEADAAASALASKFEESLKSLAAESGDAPCRTPGWEYTPQHHLSPAVKRDGDPWTPARGVSSPSIFSALPPQPITRTFSARAPPPPSQHHAPHPRVGASGLSTVLPTGVPLAGMKNSSDGTSQEEPVGLRAAHGYGTQDPIPSASSSPLAVALPHPPALPIAIAQQQPMSPRSSPQQLDPTGVTLDRSQHGSPEASTHIGDSLHPSPPRRPDRHAVPTPSGVARALQQYNLISLEPSSPPDPPQPSLLLSSTPTIQDPSVGNAEEPSFDSPPVTPPDTSNDESAMVDSSFLAFLEAAEKERQAGNKGDPGFASLVEEMTVCEHHARVGACRQGRRCPHDHIKVDRGRVLLLPSLYHSPESYVVMVDGMVMEFADACLLDHFERFYQDMFLELGLCGRIEDLVVCQNSGFHLAGNVYVVFQNAQSAAIALKRISHRFYAGRPICTELCPFDDLTLARCARFDEGYCPLGGFCNLIHADPCVSQRLRQTLAVVQETFAHQARGGNRRRSTWGESLSSVLVVDNLSREMTRKRILSHFRTFGRLTLCSVFDSVDQSFLRVFVQYASTDNFYKAQASLEEEGIDGQDIRVSTLCLTRSANWDKKPRGMTAEQLQRLANATPDELKALLQAQQHMRTHKLYIDRLPSGVTESDLTGFLKLSLKMADVDIDLDIAHIDTTQRCGMNIAVVEFTSPDGAQSAMALDNVQWQGQCIRVRRVKELLGTMDVQKKAHEAEEDVKDTPPPTMKYDWEIDASEVQLRHKLGEGGYGNIYKGMWRGMEVAVKILKHRHMSKEILEAYRAEAAVLSQLRHPNVILFMAACTTPPSLCIVTEYLPGGNLFDLLHVRKIKLDLAMVVKLATDVALGLNYLHLHTPRIIHRDLKSPNLLLDNSWNVKVADFGSSKLLMEARNMTGQIGTAQWTAPEVLRGEQYTEKADVFSFGVCLWEMVSGDLPYPGMEPLQVAMGVLNQGLRPPIPPHCPGPVAMLIRQCWATDPLQRPTFSQILTQLSIMFPHKPS